MRTPWMAAMACSIPLACAHAQGSVTIYGLMDAALSYGHTGGAGQHVWRLDSGVAGGSRLGFMGTEDLGGGLKANFLMEMGMGLDNGAFQQGGLAWGRQIFVGLAGRHWTLTAGRQMGPNEIAVVSTEALVQNYWGSSAAFGIGTLQSPASASTVGAGCQGATVRINNSLQGTYTAGPWTGKLMLAAGDENDRGTGRLVNPAVTYTAGRLTVAAGYARMRQCASDIAATARPAWQTEAVVGANYDFGPLKLFAGYYNWNPSEANKTVTPTTYVNHKAYWLGTRVPVGVGTVIAQVARLQQSFRGQGDANGKLLSLTYEHFLSKRTRLYASGAYIKNNDRANFGLIAATAAQGAAGPGANPRVLSLGTVHTF